MSELKTMWSRTSVGAKIGLLAGVLAILAFTVVLGRWALVKDYQALFTDLSEQDAATMVAELDRLKVPYRLDGARILVPHDMVHKTRLQLVGKNLPLHGAVGFEIFNNTDFGMTEFTQKVNYQRALQGELTRTIMALDEVQSARVHLALPESTLFKREQNRPKASITVALKPGRALQVEQVAGIQRLVAAAVPGVETGDVTVLDQKGITLSRRNEGGAEAAGWQLETKRQIEDHLARKVSTVLDRAFGAGQGVVSVDVLLNFDHVKVTTEEVLAAKGSEGAPAGVLVRERQTVREAARGKAEGDAAADVTNTDAEYQAGRRVEQIVGTPGSVKRINVGVVVPRGVGQDRLDHIRQLVAVAAGLDTQRGDGIAVYSLDQMSDGTPALKPAAHEDAIPVATSPAVPAAPGLAAPTADIRLVLGMLLAGALAIGVAGWWLRRALRSSAATAAQLPLQEHERAALLQNVQHWLDAPASKETS